MTTPAPPLVVIVVVVALVFVGYVVRRFWHAKARSAIPIRIHVGGTRGKSSTTRLIAAGLREAGIATLAKTTGTEPRIVLPDGSERPWRRFGPASIAEQFAFIRVARRCGARAIVLECMAVRPELVWASERLIVNATIAVLTNARADHLEEGDTRAALTELVPIAGTIIAAADAIDDTLRSRAAARGSRVVAVPTLGLAPDDANRALAQAACEIAGAAAPRWDTLGLQDDPGAFFVEPVAANGRRFRFANAFSCNDTTSLALMLERWTTRDDELVMVLNHRNDRPLRSLQFLEFFATRTPRPDLIMVDSTAWLRRVARRRGFRFKVLTADATLAALAEQVPSDAFVWGVANYHGAGAMLARAAREARCSS